MLRSTVLAAIVVEPEEVIDVYGIVVTEQDDVVRNCREYADSEGAAPFVTSQAAAWFIG